MIIHSRFALVPEGYKGKDFSQIPKDRLRITTGQFFESVIDMAKKSGYFDKVGDIVDYTSSCSWSSTVISNDAFRLIADVRMGSNEGIYINCVLQGTFDDSEKESALIGTVKSLSEDIDGYAMMGYLAGILVYCAAQLQQNDWVRFLPQDELDAWYEKQQQKDTVDGDPK